MKSWHVWFGEIICNTCGYSITWSTRSWLLAFLVGIFSSAVDTPLCLLTDGKRQSGLEGSISPRRIQQLRQGDSDMILPTIWMNSSIPLILVGCVFCLFLIILDSASYSGGSRCFSCHSRRAGPAWQRHWRFENVARNELTCDLLCTLPKFQTVMNQPTNQPGHIFKTAVFILISNPMNREDPSPVYY